MQVNQSAVLQVQIYFNLFQLGELLFVDLKQKMLVASCDVKESIMSMELMQDKQHETTALLVSKMECRHIHV